MLYIGTSNPAKVANISRLLKLIDPLLDIRDFLDTQLPVPPEIGQAELDIALSKARYYFSHVNCPVVAEDDGIYFDQKIPMSVDRNFANSDRSIKGDKFIFWKNVFVEHSVSSGHLRKAYSLVAPNFSETIIVDVPFRLCLVGNPEVGRHNILNNFMVPNGFYLPLAKLSEKEKERYYFNFLTGPIRNLLTAGGIIK